MVPGIDKGEPLAQHSTPIHAGDTIWELYQKTFSASAPTMLAAIEKVRLGNFAPIDNGYPPSYFSFPTPDDWNSFRQRGGKFI
jgi:methionyl-tRNA formyltransferase